MKLPSGLEREIGTTNDPWGGGSGFTWDVSEPSPELQFPLSTAVYDRMRRQDAQCAAVLRAITLPIRRSQWHIDPNGARDEVVQLISEDLGLPILGVEQSGSLPRLRGRFSWDEHLRQALLCLPYGFMPFEQVYRIDGDRARLAKLAPRMPATIVHIETNRGGGLDWIEQYATDTKIGVDRLVMYVNDREGGSWTGTSVLRGAYKHWLLKDKLLRLANMTIERNGMGIPTVEAPPGATPSQVRDLDKLAQSYRAGESAGGSVPHGARLRLVGVEGTIPDPLPLIRYHDEAIARNVLAQFLNLGTTQSGARALGESFIDFFQLALDAVAQSVAATATQHIVEDLVDLNFGETERAPRIGVTAADAETDLSVAALVQLVDGGVVEPDEELETYARARYRLPNKGAPRPTTAPPAVPAANLAARASARRRRTPKTATPSVDTSDPEGPWLILLPRRDALTASNRVTLTAATSDFAAAVATGPIIDAAYGVVQAAADPSDAAVVGSAAAALQTALANATGQHLRVVGHDAIVSGYAEGQVDAEALLEWAADGKISLDFAVAFDEAVKAAGNLDELWSAADDWLAEHVGATSRMIGDAVRTALVDGATRSELLDAITAVLKDAEQAAVLYDNAVAAALSVGALDKYDAVGLASVDFVTAGDARVDDHCATAEGANPYPIDDAPVPPLHVGCRCNLSPNSDAVLALA